MADLVGRVDNALSEARILVLVAQVLFAYSFEATFEPRFARLSETARHASPRRASSCRGRRRCWAFSSSSC